MHNQDDPEGRFDCHLVIYRSLLLLAVIGLVGCGTERPTKDVADRSTSAGVPSVEQERAELSKSQTADSVERLSQPSQAPEEQRDNLISQALAHQEKEEFGEASAVLRRLLLKNPQDYEVIFHLANTEAAQGRLSQAIELLGDIPANHPQAGVPSLGVSADWCFQSERYEDAEQRYRKILQIDPTINFARRKLAYLLNRQGRRHEAVALIRELCLAGDVMQDELHALIVESDAMYDPPGSRPAAASRPYWPIGEMGRARYLFTQKKYLEAASLVQPIIDSGQAPASMIAFFGRAAVEAQDEERTSLWRQHVNDQVKTYPEYWAAIGTYLIREAEYQQAVRALAEAVRLDPTDLRSIRRLFQGLRSLNQPDKADVWIEHYALMNRILRESNTIAASGSPADEAFSALADDLDSVGRTLEAILWRSVLATKKPNAKERLAALDQQRQQALADGKAFPRREQKWFEMDLGKQPLPPFPAQIALLADNAEQTSPSFVVPATAAPAAFRDTSQQIGLNHAYRVATQATKKAFAMYQTYGGGVAVLDFNLDSELDLYFVQGAADSSGFVAVESDLLYQTITTSESRRLVDVTEFADAKEQAYTVGVTAGDWNQDGFPDLAVANIGINRLLINQGDGTFRIQPLDHQPDLTRLSTSLAMGDITGDQLPDLFVTNYLRDPEIAKRPELDAAGDPVDAIPPLSVKASRDQLYVNTGEGDSRVSLVGTDESNACTGLGIIMTDLHRDHAGNEVFVANDVRNNQLWVRDAEQGLVDLAIPYGCAYGSFGSATAAMGIAAADLDRTGTIDLHVTNFADEPVSLYIGRGGIFRDLNVRFNLTDDSTPVLGFGTQAIDYSNNGWLDLVVTNGHVEDLRSRGQRFHQPLQLFANLGTSFELVDVPESDFWAKPHLGRALARLDYDRNGKTDFIVTDLLDSTALLLNESPTTNHWVSLRLVGTASERDAIGAKIEIEAGNQSWTAWVTAGDGYLCKNESAVHFGIGTEARIRRAIVTWPSGQTQSFQTIPVDKFVLLIEGDPEVFPFASPTY